MTLLKINILGVDITSNSKTYILDAVEDYLSKNKVSSPLTIFTPNPEQIVLANEQPEFKRLLNSADIALPDGVGIEWALKSSKFKVQSSKIQRIPGIEFMEDLVKLAADKGYPVALIGGREGVAGKALGNLKKKYPKLKGWAETPPEFGFKIYDLRLKNKKDLFSHKSLIVNRKSNEESDAYFEQLTSKIQESDVKLIFVGLGAPKQELFISRLVRECQMSNVKCQITLMAVGGSFDEISGKIPRSPNFINYLGLKWLWRLVLEPWRIGRQLKLLKFIFLLFRELFVVK